MYLIGSYYLDFDPDLGELNGNIFEPFYTEGVKNDVESDIKVQKTDLIMNFNDIITSE